MNLRDAAERIVRKLQDAGHAALFAGGCVRDMLMGVEPADFDVATSAPPDVVRSLFPRTVAVGEHFGVILVVERGHRFEVATFRADGEYADGRHPDTVTFTDVAGDVRRRDFTINGMMYDPVRDEVIDLVGGRDDLAARVVRAIGEPHRRFEEDRLRLLRAVRFAARLDFALEDATRAALVELAPGILAVSAERIAAELRIMLTHPSRARAVRLLDDVGLLGHVLPEVACMKGVEQSDDWHPEGDVFEHTLRCLEEAGEVDWELALAVLLHDVGKPPTAENGAFYAHEKVGADIAADVCRRLRESNRVRDKVVWLVRNHMRFRDVKKMKEITLRRLMSEPWFETLAELHLIDARASAGDFDNYDFVMDRYRRFQEEPPPVRPLVTGHDLIDRGLTPGPVFKEILDALAADQLEGKLKTREDALKALDDLLARRRPL